jgi:hypothetical protein
MFLRLSFQLRSACGSRDRSVRVGVRVRTVGRSGLPLLLHLLVHANLPLRAIRGMIFVHPVDFHSLVAKVLSHTCCSYPCHVTLRRFLRPTRCRLRFVARLCSFILSAFQPFLFSFSASIIASYRLYSQTLTCADAVRFWIYAQRTMQPAGYKGVVACCFWIETHVPRGRSLP